MVRRRGAADGLDARSADRHRRDGAGRRDRPARPRGGTAERRHRRRRRRARGPAPIARLHGRPRPRSRLRRRRDRSRRDRRVRSGLEARGPRAPARPTRVLGGVADGRPPARGAVGGRRADDGRPRIRAISISTSRTATCSTRPCHPGGHRLPSCSRSGSSRVAGVILVGLAGGYLIYRRSGASLPAPATTLGPGERIPCG